MKNTNLFFCLILIVFLFSCKGNVKSKIDKASKKDSLEYLVDSEEEPRIKSDWKFLVKKGKAPDFHIQLVLVDQDRNPIIFDDEIDYRDNEITPYAFLAYEVFNNYSCESVFKKLDL